MRLAWLTMLLSVMVVLGVMSSVAAAARVQGFGVVASNASYAQDPPKVNVDINVNKGGGGGNWYANPLWIAIGGLGVVVLVVLVVMASKGGTTVVKG